MKRTADVDSGPMSAGWFIARPRCYHASQMCMARVFQTVVLVVFLLVMLLVNPAHAQILWEPDTGVPIRGYRECHPSLVLPGQNPGESLVVWGDPRSGDWDFYGQLMDADGNRLWEDDGRPLITAPGHQYEAAGVAIEGGWVLASREDISHSQTYLPRKIILQRFDGDGTPLWSDPSNPPEHGIRLHNDDRHIGGLAFLPDNSGGLYIATKEAVNPGDHTFRVFVYRLLMIDGSRDPLWPEDGVLLSVDDSLNCRDWDTLDLFSDEMDGVLAVWGDSHIYTQHVSPLGVIAWDTTPFTRVYRYEWSVCPDGLGGLYFGTTKRERMPNNDIREQIRLERLLPDGTHLFGGEGYEATPMRFQGAHVHSLIPSEPGSFILVADVYGPKALRLTCTNDLGVAWDDSIAVPIGDGGLIQTIISDTEDGVLVVEKCASNGFLFHQITADGNLFTAPDTFRFGDTDPVFGISNGIISLICPSRFQDECYIRYASFDPFQHTWTPLPSGSVVISALNGHYWRTDNANLRVNDGFAYIAWHDSRYSWFDNTSHRRMVPYIQKVDLSSGETLFEEDGSPMMPGYVGDDSPTRVYYFQMDTDNEGSVFAGFTGALTEDGPATALFQKVNDDGNPLWGDRGVFIGWDEGDNFRFDHIEILPDQSGGLYSAFEYNDYSGGLSGLGLAYFNTDGEPQWVNGGRDHILLDGLQASAIPAGWERFAFENVPVLAYNYDGGLYLSAIGENGGAEWTVALDDSGNGGFDPVDMLMLDDYLLIVWDSLSSSQRGQLVDFHGNTYWDTEAGLLGDVANVRALRCSVADSTSSTFWIAWDVSHEIVYAQRFDLAGYPLTDPVAIEGREPIQLQANEDGSAYVTTSFIWAPGPDNPETVRCVLVGPDGTRNPQVVKLGPKGYVISNCGLEADGEGGIIVLWSDERLDVLQGSFRTGVFSQRVFLPTVNVFEALGSATPETFNIESAYPNPFNGRAVVTVTVPRPGGLNVALFNVLGQEVMEIVQGRYREGEHNIALDASDLASGVYYVRAQSVEHGWSATQKIVLMK